MSITLGSVDFVQPDGELSGYLFPENDIDNLLAGWLAKAAEQVVNVPTASQNDAAQAYVYHRAYQHISLRMANEFASKNINSGAGNATISTTAEQRDYFRKRADFWLASFNGYNTDTTGPQAAIPAFFGKVSVRRQAYDALG